MYSARKLLWALCPFFVIALASPYVASRLGRTWAGNIAHFFADPTCSEDEPEQSPLGEEPMAIDESGSLDDFESTAEHLVFADSGKQASKRHYAAESRRSIYISAATVLCLAQQGMQPTGKPVTAKGKRPAGVAVFGVSVLGLGVRDGDVVTDILGQPVRSVAQGIAMIIMARASKRSTISGTAWRSKRPYSVTVEQPYTMPDCSPDEAECWKSHCAKGKNAKITPRATHGPSAPSKGEGRHP